MTVNDVVRRYGVSKATVHKWIGSGRIPAHKVGRVYIIPDDVEIPSPTPANERWRSRKNTPMSELSALRNASDECKREFLWWQSIGTDKPLEWFAKLFGVTVDEVRDMYDQEMQKRLGG